LGQSLQRPGGLEAETPVAGRFLLFFNKNNAFLCIFRPNSYFKAITHQLKWFKISPNVLNRINKVQVLCIRINVTNDVTFATNGEPPTLSSVAMPLNQNIIFNSHVRRPTTTFISFDVICKSCRFVCSSIVASLLYNQEGRYRTLLDHRRLGALLSDFCIINLLLLF